MAPYVVLGLLALLGVRLIVIGRRARSWAEALLGGAFLLLGPGAGAMRYGLQHADRSIALQAAAVSTGGIILLLAFTHRTFRDGEPLGLGLMIGLAAANVGGYLHQIHIDAVGVRPSPLLIAARAAALGWAAFESARYLRMYRRREAFGLADPVIANRFLLYTVWTSLLTGLAVVVLVSSHLQMGGAMEWRSLYGALIAPAVLAAVVCVVLTFVPPAAYLGWVERRAQRAPTPAAEAS